MKYLLFYYIFILNVVFTYPNMKPDLNGKFFYADLREGVVYGMSMIDVLIGSQK
jgi:hypothetical protein